MNGATTTTTTTKKKESISANKCKQQFQHERTENSKSYKESIESSNEGQWYKLGPIQKGDNIKKKLFSNIYLENSHYYNTMQVRINLKTNYKNISYRQQTYLLCKIARNTLVSLQIYNDGVQRRMKDLIIICWAGVNFINILRTNFSYERRFGSFSLVTCT